MGETIHHEVRGCLFVWDADKAAVNLKKHKVSFQSACGVFFDPFYLMMQDIGEHGEDRRIGTALPVSVLSDAIPAYSS
jgi:uncharacterized DUF497 family protein